MLTDIVHPLASGRRYFTKLFKPVCPYLEDLGHVCFLYIDDSFILGNANDFMLPLSSLIITLPIWLP